MRIGLIGAVLVTAVAGAANPIIYEISTRPWLYELSIKYNRPISLSDPAAVALIQKELLALQAAYRPDYIWMMGVWELGAYGLNLDRTTKQAEFNTILPGYANEDVIGSPYAVANYTCNPSIGSDADLRSLKTFLNSHGMKLMLDFVPNHVAVDHPWTCSHPEYLLPIDQANLGAHSCAKGPSVKPPCQASRKFYTGGDYWNSGWTDTVQLNYWNPALRAAQIDTLRHIASLADGIRCDMAMSVLNREIALAWVKDDLNWECTTGSQGRMPDVYANNPPTTEFWADAITALRKSHPDLLLMAENYNYGFTPTPEDVYLQSLGFDLTYDMDALKKLTQTPIGTGQNDFLNLVRGHGSYAKSVHFVENHDDNRAAGTMFNFKASAARAGAAAVATLPGAKLFFHGQFDCNPNRLSVQLRRGVKWAPDAYCNTWFQDLLATLADDVHQKGSWQGAMSAPYSTPDGSNVVAWKWKYNCTERLVVVNFRDAWSNVNVPLLFPNIANKSTLVVVTERLLGAGLTTKRSWTLPVKQLESTGLSVVLSNFDSQIFDYSICPPASPITTPTSAPTTTLAPATPTTTPVSAKPTVPANASSDRGPAAWKKRSVYQVLTDRFAGSKAATCTDLSTYCGGTFRGLQANLPYIKGMGFDAIWISPVVANSPGGYHGYWTQNFEAINEYFGTPADLKALIAAAHALDIWVMVDVVANHVAPVGNDFSSIYPFNQSAHYHADCAISNWANQTQVETCRLAGLPDLDQSHPFVRKYLLSWIRNLVTEYGFDGVRVDTVPEIAKDFWVEFNAAAAVFQVGEVFNGDPAYVGGYQPALTSLLNYPMSFTISDVFGKGYGMGGLKSRYDGEIGAFSDLDALGSFVDNHDNPRFLFNFPGKHAQLRAATIFSLTARGIPFVYYGTEQYYAGGVDPANREPLWPTMNTNSDFYKLIAVVNAQRKASQIWNTPWVERYSSNNFYSYSRGQFLVALTNTNAQQHFKVSYHPFKDGEVVCNIFWPKDDCQTVSGGVDIYLNDGESKIYVLKSALALV
ncbi:alpha-amylase [Achlya hypogyna]|uniref:Alpha-amylase n=1 Tax=Achlya hypogyna TaxID=1202772 RepID=A0A0A7CPK9_ACHHY|nr:secreted protein [Achlya hypogyna]OQR83869.1 alpha-amylase [Achlya hypogyna]